MIHLPDFVLKACLLHPPVMVLSFIKDHYECTSLMAGMLLTLHCCGQGTEGLHEAIISAIERSEVHLLFFP